MESWWNYNEISCNRKLKIDLKCKTNSLAIAELHQIYLSS